MKQRIYIDTSVVGGYFDEEFKEATTMLFDRLDKNEIIFVVSDLLDLELLNAPQHVRQLLHNYLYSGQSEPLNPVQSEPVIPAQSEPPFRV